MKREEVLSTINEKLKAEALEKVVERIKAIDSDIARKQLMLDKSKEMKEKILSLCEEEKWSEILNTYFDREGFI